MDTRTPLSGRIGTGPSRLLHDEILAPQFRHEMAHLLRWYVLIEKILLLEYERLGLVDAPSTRVIGGLLHELTGADLEPAPERNMSDPAFAVERHVEQRLRAPAPAWHVDRSRNDLQATAQLMAARDWLLGAAEDLLDTAQTAIATGAELVDVPIPGHTQLQAAQVMSPGFHLAALASQALDTTERLLETYDHFNLSPLGAGALTGQEVAFDRDRMARLGGFAGPVPHALIAVASRSWALQLAADLSVFGVTLSRFVTDLMTWGGSDCGYLVLPDELSGISAAMPQKRNYPVLERIRGRTARLSSCFVDVILAQRNTPFTNMIEVSKESTAGVRGMIDDLGSVLRLLRAVLAELSFDGERARRGCESEFLGGFTLANQLTLHAGVPWRRAQVIAGQYIAAAIDRKAAPSELDADLLAGIAEAMGYPLEDPVAPLAHTAAGDGLTTKVTDGSTHPDTVGAQLADLSDRTQRLRDGRRSRAETISAAIREVDTLLGLPTAPGGST